MNRRPALSNLMPMTDQVQEHPGELEVEVEQFTKLQFISEVLQGMGIALGLSFLWVLEIGRNAIFRMLDRLNIRARPRRGTAFPPGPARRHTTVDAQR